MFVNNLGEIVICLTGWCHCLCPKKCFGRNQPYHDWSWYSRCLEKPHLLCLIDESDFIEYIKINNLNGLYMTHHQSWDGFNRVWNKIKCNIYTVYIYIHLQPRLPAFFCLLWNFYEFLIPFLILVYMHVHTTISRQTIRRSSLKCGSGRRGDRDTICHTGYGSHSSNLSNLSLSNSAIVCIVCKYVAKHD